MTIRFATARPALNGLSARLGRPSRAPVAANDNGDPLVHDRTLREALKLFAAHGLGAAEHARARAERAFFAGDSERYRHWLGICRTLDRRMAALIPSGTASRPA